MKNGLIVVAGGKGTRFGSKNPKQFLTIDGKAIYIHTLCAFLKFDPDLDVVLVLPQHASQQMIDEVHATINQQLNVRVTTCLGGETRFESVKNGLAEMQANTEIVGVHDAVRPLVSNKVIETCFSVAYQQGNAVPIVPLTSSLRKVVNKDSEAVNRNNFAIVQTPQCFRHDILKEAYLQPYSTAFTDDASVVEAAGYKIKLVEGNSENIKITTPPDFVLAEYYLKNFYD